VNLGFRHELDENCSLLGYYAARCGNISQTFRDNLSVPSYSLRNNPEERSFQKFFIARVESQSAMARSAVVTAKGILANTRKTRHYCINRTGIRYDLQISVPRKTFFSSMCTWKKMYLCRAEDRNINRGSKPYIELKWYGIFFFFLIFHSSCLRRGGRTFNPSCLQYAGEWRFVWRYSTGRHGRKLAWDNGSACTHSWNERYEGYRYLRYCFWLCCFWMQFGKKFHGVGPHYLSYVM